MKYLLLKKDYINDQLIWRPVAQSDILSNIIEEKTKYGDTNDVICVKEINYKVVEI